MHLAYEGMVTSRGIEPRSLGLQPSAMTTLARWSEWSRCRESNPDLLLTGQACCQQHFIDTWSRLEDSNPDSPVIGRTSCHWTKPGRWSRRLESNQHGSA
jgi:hypothetical protein